MGAQPAERNGLYNAIMASQAFSHGLLELRIACADGSRPVVVRPVDEEAYNTTAPAMLTALAATMPILSATLRIEADEPAAWSRIL